MEDRSIQSAPAEMPAPHNTAVGGTTPGRPIDDPRALAILTTEHWSLLSARSLVYNEAFARAGMFLAFLSATLVAMGLVATATGVNDGFFFVATFVLSVDLFIGFASLGRMAGASVEDIRYLQGMNRLRHAYHEMVPGLERYFISRKHDDVVSVLSGYGTEPGFGRLGGLLHAFTTTPVMISVICCAVAGAIAAMVAMLLTHAPLAAGIVGLVAFVFVFAAVTAYMARHFGRVWMKLSVAFPPDVEPTVEEQTAAR